MRVPHWQPVSARLLNRAPPALRPWIDWRRSMTRKLEARFGQKVAVTVLYHGAGRPFPDERAALGATAPVLVREVILSAGPVPVLAARTIIPAATATGLNRRLLRLGDRPLGDVLFSPGAGAPRGLAQRDAARVTVAMPLWRRLRLGTVVPGNEALWGRRTIFLLHGRPLLVTEIFLPTVGVRRRSEAIATKKLPPNRWA